MTRAAAALAVLCAGANARAAEPQRLLWNLTAHSLTVVRIAPAGSGAFGPNLCLDDPDHAVDHDERLKIGALVPGRYDLQVGDASGKLCAIGGVEAAPGKVAFTVTDADLTRCSP